MVSFDDIFQRLVDTQIASFRSGDEPHVAGPACGVAASALVGFSAPAGLATSTASLSAGTVVFEGLPLSTGLGSWSANEIRGNDYGVRLADSGLAEGMRMYADHQSGEKPATKVGALVDMGSGYGVGTTVDSIAPESTGETSVELFAMSLNARLDPTVISPYENFYNLEYQQEASAARLDGLYSQIATGDTVVVEAGESIGAAVVVLAQATPSTVPATNAIYPVTRLILVPAPIVPAPSATSTIRVWYNARKAGTLERIPTKTVTLSDFLHIPRPVTLAPNTLLPKQDTDILVQDAEGTTLRAKGGGELQGQTPYITITEVLDDFDGELVKPITFLWGLTKVTRGETVNREVIGSGDATQRWQSFRLARSPLTYVADPFAPGGRRPEIEVFVNGVAWRRAQSFYKATPQDEIYVVRHDAEHQTFIQFGDGELGKRLPTGTRNVVATYRFGVGGNVEANTITKLVRPIKGVSEVYNPLPATGGEDPPTEQEAREKAIQSTRVLGRLVSLADFEVEAARYGGVVRAKALWVWDKAGEDAVVKVWIICADEGDPSADLRSYLMNMAEPDARVLVCRATKFTREIDIDLELDPKYLPEQVWAAVDARLFDEFDGLLAPRNVPIGGAFHRSGLYAAIHEIDGVLSVQGVLLDGTPMPRAVLMGEGEYPDFAYPAAG